MPSVRRVAQGLHLPLWHEAAAYARRDEIMRDALWSEPPIDAVGHPLLLVGGMGSTPQLLAPLRDLLRRFNFHCAVAPIHLGLGCGEQTAQLVAEALAGLVDSAGRPAIVVAHSRGGQFARAVTVRQPELVGGLITLGSPLTRLLAVHPWLRVQCGLLGLAGSMGLFGLMRPSCLWGGCCSALRRDLTGSFPSSVPFTSIYSTDDRIVDWRSCLDPAARHVEVRASHAGLLWSPESLRVVTSELTHMIDSPHAADGCHTAA